MIIEGPWYTELAILVTEFIRKILFEPEKPVVPFAFPGLRTQQMKFLDRRMNNRVAGTSPFLTCPGQYIVVGKNSFIMCGQFASGAIADQESDLCRRILKGFFNLISIEIHIHDHIIT